MKEKEYCIQCRKEVDTHIEKRKVKKVIRDKEYEFEISVPLCSECGEEIGLPEYLDINAKEIDEQYRNAENIISIEDIKKIMQIYHIGKSPLSLVLGFGEITVSRYLLGQVPSMEYSEVMKRALSSPAFMKERLMINKHKIADSAYKKALKAIEEIECTFTISSKLMMIISYIFERLEEVTPLMLQKLLYFVQGVSLAIYDQALFDEDCEAWVHGPVYADVYNLFKDFKYNPIDDVKFAIFKEKSNDLSEKEKSIIDLVLNTFGIYGGKVLELITHHEEPWIKARKGVADYMPSNEIIEKKDIQQYFSEVHAQYVISNEKGLGEYIQYMLFKSNHMH